LKRSKKRIQYRNTKEYARKTAEAWNEQHSDS
jgi:hypothetical protein